METFEHKLARVKTIKLICATIVVATFALAQTHHQQDVVRRADLYKSEVDTLVAHAKDSLLIFVKEPDTDSLIRITDTHRWPDEVELTCNMFFDTKGRLVYYCEIPFSKSGDWYAEFQHYFDTTGSVLLVVSAVSSFNSGCTEILRQRKKSYYDTKGKLISTSSSLTDKDFNPVSTKDCYFNYDFPVTVYPSVQQLPVRVRQSIARARNVAR